MRRRQLLEQLGQAVDGAWFGCFPRGLRERWLNAAISEALQDFPVHAQFSVPVNRVLRVHEGAFSVRVPVGLLRVRLHDWVSCQGEVMHTANYFLCTGDWSGLLLKGAKTRTMHEAISLHAVGLDFLRSSAYLQDKERIAQGRFFRRNKVLIDRIELLDAYYARFVRMFESIARFGVLPLAEARQRVPNLYGKSSVRGWRASQGERDIGVALGAKGELIVLPGAKHRLAIATVLKTPMVPVQVRMVHGDWLRTRCGAGQMGWAEILRREVFAFERGVLGGF